MYVCSIGTICQGTAHAQVISMYWRHLLRLLSFLGFFDEVGFPLLYLFFSSFGVQEGTANLPILTVDHRVFSFPSPFCGVKYPCQVLVEERSKVNPIVSDYQFYISSSTFFFFLLRPKQNCDVARENSFLLYFLLRHWIRRAADPRL